MRLERVRARWLRRILWIYLQTGRELADIRYQLGRRYSRIRTIHRGTRQDWSLENQLGCKVSRFKQAVVFLPVHAFQHRKCIRLWFQWAEVVYNSTAQQLLSSRTIAFLPAWPKRKATNEAINYRSNQPAKLPKRSKWDHLDLWRHQGAINVKLRKEWGPLSKVKLMAYNQMDIRRLQVC